MEESINQLLSYAGKRMLFVGIGNILRSDDGIGVYIVNRMDLNQNISKLIVEVSLENYISTINKISPDILVLVDCIDFNEKPGYFCLLPVSDITEKVIHSHHITFARITDFFRMPVFVLGIQPENLKVGEELTDSVKEAGDRLLSCLSSVFSASNPITEEKSI